MKYTKISDTELKQTNEHVIEKNKLLEDKAQLVAEKEEVEKRIADIDILLNMLK